MKVNELKALYQKKHIIIAQPQNPSIHNKIHPEPIVQPLPTPKPSTQIIITQETPIPTHQTELSSGSIRKNANFLDELNKKLQNKTRQSQLQQNFHYYSREQTDIRPQKTLKEESKIQNQQQIGKSLQSLRPKSKTFDPQPQQQLDFSKIIGSQNEGLIKSRIRARLAVDERHPITKQDKILFTELDSQIRETIEAEQVEKQNKLKSEQEIHKSINRQDIAKSLIQNTKIEEKINRIDFFLACIFGEKQKQFIGQKSMQNIGPNIVDLFNEKMKTFKKHSINSEVICLTTQPILQSIPASLEPKMKKQQDKMNLQASATQQKMIEQVPSVQIQANNLRPNLSMTKQILQEMNMKLKRRNNLLQPPSDNISSRIGNERSVSPINKKKRVFEKFDDA